MSFSSPSGLSLPAPAMLQEFVVANNVYLRQLYYTDLENGPCIGWQHALLHEAGSKIDIFCPFSGTEFNVGITHPVIESCKLPRFATVPGILEYLYEKWSSKLNTLPGFVQHAMHPDQFAPPIRAEVNENTQTDTRRIKRNGKRGKFLEFIVNYEGPVPIKLLVTTFKIKRNNVLSYLYQMKKVNNIDYVLNKSQDTVYVILPAGEVWEN